jgi:hypothetical protein
MRFADATTGDQVELRAKGRSASWLTGGDTRDPERPVRVAIITHRWHDPVEDREYVALAPILRGGAVGKPTLKHTIRGLAQAGWYPARRDWLAYARALDDGHVVSIVSRAAK